ncbi:ATP-dependent DNA helicase DinG [Alkalihalobacillus sp. MEB130]|uniref:ATP-dependent DNA helicase DinG n=1 Tax=Alkalihalobacillus sp. MEB130 TaxID=2976704 RepID=UPI0028E02FF7|nr:ATP-dependent DNA helicase DinG [Alkalihalobacillus sp. MEB130]MDT8859978.1 ATP-dependent DNA helicase DinG [Alkalihalobacillus sp. MEB130]
MKERYIVVDVETTGHSVSKGDRVIQIGAVIIEDGEMVETFASFVNPGQTIPPFIEELTGISDVTVANAPSFREIIPELMPLLTGSYFVAHNVDFDRAFLKNQLELEGYTLPEMPVYDTVELARVLLPKQESYKLGQLAEQLGFSHERPHQADSDAEVTATLFLSLLHKLQQLPLLTLQHLVSISRKFKSDLEPLLQSFIQEKLIKGHSDEEQYDCYRQIALKKLVEDSDDVTIPDEQETFSDYCESLFSEDGKMHSAFSNYELRPGQQKMMNEVDESFRQNEHKMIEAGTGTGKSLAYLLPAAYFSYSNKEPVIISTQTIPLQEQLLSRDLPLLHHLLPFKVKATLLKGRSHYLCLRKFEQSLASIHEDSYDVLLTKALLLIWLTETEHGDIEELNLPSGGKGFWYEVQSDAASDLGRYSPWFSRCFYHRARKRAQKSDIVITNHALLCTDLVHDQRLLPTYSYAVLDEAHHLEETASDHLGAKADFLTFSYLFQRLGLTEEEGIVNRLDQLLEEYQVSVPFEHMSVQLISLKEELDELFRMLHGYVLSKNKTSATDVGRLRYRYESYTESSSMWQAILECAMRVHMQMKDALKKLQNRVRPLIEKKEDMVYKDRSFLANVEGILDQLYVEEQTLYELLLEHDPNLVYWLEVEPRGAKNATYLYSKPIDVSDILADQFFAKKKSVILTSATLSVNGSFNYQERRLGLTDFGVKKSVIPSPFSYMEQVKLLLPSDIPAIKEVSDEEFATEVSIKLWRMMESSSGKMLVLFTSYEMLKQVYYHVKKFNEFGSFQLIGQGVTSGSRAKLMKMFKQTNQAILFGTSSFWEGIDLPGDELRNLVIVRLPFSPPDQPLLQAQYEKAKEEGKNPFMEISLPQAIIRFKQGFGRLIRTTTDRGCVFILDRRISTTRYGKQFIKSLPEVPVHEGKLEDLMEQFKEYM